MIALAIGGLVYLISDLGTYSSFSEAAEFPDKKHQVVGELVKSEPLIYDPGIDPNYFSFQMIDQDSLQETVVFRGSKPQDFERSEQVVITGKMKEDFFEASDMLVKCPSKYTAEEIKVKAVTADK